MNELAAAGILMPRLGGLDVLRRLKADERTQPIPMAVESYPMRVNNYAVKPVEFTEFTQVVAQAGL